MKTVTIDYDQYHEELSKAKAEGRHSAQQDFYNCFIDLLNGKEPRAGIEIPRGCKTSPNCNAMDIAQEIKKQLKEKGIRPWECEITVSKVIPF